MMLNGMAAAFCFEIPFEAHGGPPGTDGMHIPSNSLLAHRYWGVTFDSLLFNRAIEASTYCDPRVLPCILDTVHRRLVELLAVADSCLDTTVSLLTKEDERCGKPQRLLLLTQSPVSRQSAHGHSGSQWVNA